MANLHQNLKSIEKSLASLGFEVSEIASRLPPESANDITDWEQTAATQTDALLRSVKQTVEDMEPSVAGILVEEWEEKRPGTMSDETLKAQGILPTSSILQEHIPEMDSNLASLMDRVKNLEKKEPDPQATPAEFMREMLLDKIKRLEDRTEVNRRLHTELTASLDARLLAVSEKINNVSALVEGIMTFLNVDFADLGVSYIAADLDA